MDRPIVWQKYQWEKLQKDDIQELREIQDALRDILSNYDELDEDVESCIKTAVSGIDEAIDNNPTGEEEYPT